jgi:hypothetical protein
VPGGVATAVEVQGAVEPSALVEPGLEPGVEALGDGSSAPLDLRPPAPAAPAGVAPVARAVGLVRALGARVGRRALGLAALAVLAFVVLRFVPEALQKPWQSVQIEPVRIRGGARVVLRGSEVEPSASLRIMVGDQEAKVDSMQPGQILFTAPRLPTAEAGVRPVVLRVERRGIVLVRQNLHYETTPDVTGIDPPEAEVGTIVTLRGTGFSTQAALVSVRIGELAAKVVEARPTTLKVRVPVVTRSGVITAPVGVRVAEWSAAPTTLRVKPRTAPCLSLAFTAESVAARTWALRHPLGVAALVEGGPPAVDGSPPAAVERGLRALSETFAAAATDPTAHFEVRGGQRDARLVGVARGGTREVGRWGPAVFAHVRANGSSLARLELLPYWNAVVLNELLNVFAKRQPPRLLPAGSRLQPVLSRLNRLNFDAGGLGCPTEEELETLTPVERAAFDGAILAAPSDYGEVAGAWEGQLENAFSDDAKQAQLDLRLELSQEGVAVEARAFVYEVRGPGIRWAPPSMGGLKGRVLLGGETRLELTVSPRPPYHITGASGTLVDGVLEGTFRTSRGREARFELRPAGQ